MTAAELQLAAVLALALVGFVQGRFGPDLVSLAALMACVLLGLVPAAAAFQGFGHPAVVTVVAVLVIGRALQVSGAVHSLFPAALSRARRPTPAILGLTALAAVLSSFINNVGALALLMPAGLQTAGRVGVAPARVLLPIAFGASLGGMTTLIGTPSNFVVSSFRSGGFSVFDFTPVGGAVAAAGVLFIGLVGWKLVPARAREGTESFETGAYLTEARVLENSRLAGRTLRELGPELERLDAQIVGLVRHEHRVLAPGPERILNAGDVLVVEAEPANLAEVLSGLGLGLVADGRVAAGQPAPRNAAELALTELTVRPGSELVGQTARSLELRSRYGVNLLAISRQGRRSVRRLRSEPIRAGDVLLIQGAESSVGGFAAEYGCVPLAERAVHVPRRRFAVIGAAALIGAVALTSAGLMEPAPAFVLAVLAVLGLGVLPAQKAYAAVEWPVVVVLGALLPVAEAMERTGLAERLARGLVEALAGAGPGAILAAILAATMSLTCLVNNAATAAIMAPIGLSAAARLGAPGDAFLIAVGVGASAAFLTPIGHQNNLLVMGPGGLRFGDYWRLGLPLSLIVLAVGSIAIRLVWG